jgi:plasmid maintenance system killer protein
MLKTFGSKETEKIWTGVRSSKFPPEIQKIGRRKLRMIKWQNGHAYEVEIIDYHK